MVLVRLARLIRVVRLIRWRRQMITQLSSLDFHKTEYDAFFNASPLALTPHPPVKGFFEKFKSSWMSAF